MNSITKIAALSGRSLSNHVRHSSYSVAIKPATLSEMPQPRGSWKAENDAKQRGNNARLFGGIGFFIVTISVGIVTGHFNLQTGPELKNKF